MVEKSRVFGLSSKTLHNYGGKKTLHNYGGFSFWIKVITFYKALFLETIESDQFIFRNLCKNSCTNLSIG